MRRSEYLPELLHRRCPVNRAIECQYQPLTIDDKQVLALIRKQQEKAREGPGTELKRILGWLHIKPTEDCQCEAHAAEMNKNGPEWCEENIDAIVGWMEQEAQKRCLLFVRPVAAGLVKLAIRRARRKARKHREET